MSEQVGDHIASGFVQYNYFEGHHKKFKSGFASSLERFSRTAQGYAYKQCIKHHKANHTFLGFIDFDEFLVFMDPNVTSAEQLLRPYEAYGGVSFHWILAGPNNHTSRPAAGVVDSYTSCLRKDIINHRQFKTFVNTRHSPRMSSPHRAIFRKLKGGRGYLVNEDKSKIKRGFKNIPTHHVAAVYHYVTKSWEDYEAKLRRGGGAGITRDAAFFHYIQKKAVLNCSEPRAMRDRMCPATIKGGAGAAGVAANASDPHRRIA